MEKSKRKTVLITGTSSGFGKLTAIQCASLGHQVFATMRDTSGRNFEKARELANYPNIQVLEVEVTDYESVNKAISTLIQESGKIDVLINNAGIYPTGITETFTDEEVKKVLDINLVGTWRTMKAVLPQMRKQGEGLIVNLSSLSGRFSAPFMAIYSASKFALEGLTEGLHYETRPLGIDIVTVQPGPFPTEIFGKIMTGSESKVLDGYGELSKIPDQMGKGLQEMFNALQPNPQMVADAILDLINLPKGQRPLRTVVSVVGSQYTESANRHVKEQYDHFMAAFGMKELLA
ncbi:MAG: SDR family oxidoreductase [Haliscomenobacter sp.]|uniref:SDR family oxidoreductase n=1 Tax=Haliscomenobacter sp. TaxID=2717303 RepID=UPI0029ADF612|nr:SDR family oxidoreductase [Haliscomenobacter sp.]MDX2070861.1 SDR family oxidoreductase [Haliscomenobacter sp.]